MVSNSLLPCAVGKVKSEVGEFDRFSKRRALALSGAVKLMEMIGEADALPKLMLVERKSTPELSEKCWHEAEFEVCFYKGFHGNYGSIHSVTVKLGCKNHSDQTAHNWVLKEARYFDTGEPEGTGYLSYEYGKETGCWVISQ